MSEPASSDARLAEMASPLAWLRDLLWPVDSGSQVALTRGGGRSSSDVGMWALMPSAANPTVLIPVSGRAGGSALRQFNDSMSQMARVRKAVVGAAVRRGGGALVARDRLVVTKVGVGAEALDLMGSVLPRILGEPRIEVAISIGRQLRPNLKPVLQIMDPEGVVLAYAKIGWNDLTKDLVRNEARTLRAWGSAPPRQLEVPRLIHEGDWNGSAITVLSPNPHRLFRRGRRNALPSADILGEVASLGGTELAPLGASLYWARLKERIDGIAMTEASRNALRSVLTRLEASRGDQELRFGSSHGDLAPWNMSLAGGKLFVWDWERCARPTPVGSDALHFWFEVGFHKEGLDVPTASRSALTRSLETFDRLGIAHPARDTLLQLFLIERMLRVEEGRVAGVPVHRDLSAALLRELSGG
ncbi:MAG: hypothetical protein ABI595_06220 [Actinomycetota bacterium]